MVVPHVPFVVHHVLVVAHHVMIVVHHGVVCEVTMIGVSIVCGVVLAIMVIATFIFKDLSLSFSVEICDFQIKQFVQSIFSVNVGSGVISNFFNASISPPASLDAIR